MIRCIFRLCTFLHNSIQICTCFSLLFEVRFVSESVRLSLSLPVCMYEFDCINQVGLRSCCAGTLHGIVHQTTRADIDDRCVCMGKPDVYDNTDNVWGRDSNNSSNNNTDNNTILQLRNIMRYPRSRMYFGRQIEINQQKNVTKCKWASEKSKRFVALFRLVSIFVNELRLFICLCACVMNRRDDDISK